MAISVCSRILRVCILLKIKYSKRFARERFTLVKYLSIYVVHKKTIYRELVGKHIVRFEIVFVWIILYTTFELIVLYRIVCVCVCVGLNAWLTTKTTTILFYFILNFVLFLLTQPTTRKRWKKSYIVHIYNIVYNIINALVCALFFVRWLRDGVAAAVNEHKHTNSVLSFNLIYLF